MLKIINNWLILAFINVYIYIFISLRKYCTILTLLSLMIPSGLFELHFIKIDLLFHSFLQNFFLLFLNLINIIILHILINLHFLLYLYWKICLTLVYIIHTYIFLIFWIGLYIGIILLSFIVNIIINRL